MPAPATHAAGLDRELGTRFPHKAWSRFCQGAKWDATVARTGKSSLAVAGGTYTGTMPQWKYFNRQGAVQFVSLNQTDCPEPIVLRAFSKAQEVATSEEVVLDTPAARGHHFDAREGHAYCMHLYLDYQDGQWPRCIRCSSRQAPTTGRSRASAWSPRAR